MSDEYKLKDFLEEVSTLIWEKSEVLSKFQAKSNVPMAGLTQIRVDRLKALREYLQAIAKFQAEKAGGAVEEKEPAPTTTLPPEPEVVAAEEPAAEELVDEDDFGD